MKKSIVIFALLLNYTLAVSQTQKGSLNVGVGLGSIGFSSQKYENSGEKSNDFSLGIYPRALYFISDGLAVGGSVGLRFSLNSSHYPNNEYSYKFSQLNLSLGPAVQYYFEKTGKGMPFVGSTLYISPTLFERIRKPESSSDYRNLSLDLAFEISGGYEYFVSENLGISGSAGLSYTKNSSKIEYTDGNNSETGFSKISLDLTIAFNIHIPAGTKFK